MKRQFVYIAFLLLAFCQIAASCQQADETTELKLWYPRPATEWMTSALPIGNGELGAMFFGGIDRERLQFNEKTLWTGSTEKRGAYQNFGDVYIDFEGMDTTEVMDYRRELSLDEAIGRVSYRWKETDYVREYFASHPDGVVVARFVTPGKSGQLNFTVSLKDGRDGIVKITGQNVFLLQSRLDLLSYEAQLKVMNEGGTLTAEDGCLKVSDADAVTLLLTGATNFSLSSPDYIGETKEQLHERLSKRMEQASARSYGQLKERHLADYQPLFERVKLDLGAALPEIPTDELVRSHRESLYLDMLYFQYGRYLMLASSRGMNLPSNLQGIWNDSNTPPWECDIHSNINVQMNYWPAETCNLSECHLPYLNYIATEALRPDGSWQQVAQSEGLRGWAMRTQNNIFGYTDWNINRPANAWYCMHLWQHYRYTLDTDFLVETAFPVMRSACEYWFGRLKEDENGKLIAPDDWSPEQGPWEDGVAYAQQLVWQLFSETSQAVQALQKHGETVDEAFAMELASNLERLDNGVEVGEWGQIKEWKQDSWHLDTLGNQHRHLSQLIALYPGNQISNQKTPELAKAAQTTLNSRGDLGTGWSRAWKIACWARLGDGNHAYRLLKSALNFTTTTSLSMDNDKGGVYENLFDAHPPFQIDGNFGATAGIAEMLLQSHQDYIRLLPALPEAWPAGKVAGLRAAGNFTFCLEWEEHALRKCSFLSGSGGECRIYSPDVPILSVKNNSSLEVEVRQEADGVYVIPTERGGSYQLVLE